MVLLTEGLSVIIKAIIGSRMIFQRMRNYATYACTTTIRIVTTFGILACVWQYTFPPFLVLIIAILNDGTIMTVSTDRVDPSPHPDKWRLKDIFINAFVLGFYLSVSSIIFFYIIQETTWFEDTFGVTPVKYISPNPVDPSSKMMNSLMYLQVSITGQLVIFNTRTRSFFWTTRPSYFLMFAFVVAQLVATFLSVYADIEFTQISPIGWGWAAICWVYGLCFSLPLDIPKIILRRLMEDGVPFVSNFEEVFHMTISQRTYGGAHAHGLKGQAEREATVHRSAQTALRS